MICLVEVDVYSAKKIYNSGAGAHYIAVYPSHKDILRTRVKNSLNATTEEINNLLENSMKEIEEIKNVSFITYRIVNDEVETAFEDFKNAVISTYPYLKSEYQEVLSINK